MIVTGISDGVEKGREREAAGQAGSRLASLVVCRFTSDRCF